MPRKEEEVPTAVKLAQQLMTRVGDFSALGEDDDMYTNVKALASTFASVGDLTEFSEEISTRVPGGPLSGTTLCSCRSESGLTNLWAIPKSGVLMSRVNTPASVVA